MSTTKQQVKYQAEWQEWMDHIMAEGKAARDGGRLVHVIKLNLGSTTARWTGRTANEGMDVAGAIQGLESIGWQLADVGYVYQPLDEKSRVLTESVRMTGQIVGIYTFRAGLAPVPSRVDGDER